MKSAILKTVLILAGLVILSDTRFIDQYSSSMPTNEKFERLLRWLPDDADFLLVADVNRIAAMSAVSNYLPQLGPFRSLLTKQKNIGMIALAANFGELPSISIIVQGEFDPQAFVEEVRQKLIGTNAVLEPNLSNGVVIYNQKGDDDEFTFALPDVDHLIIGTGQSIENIIKNSGGSKKNASLLASASPLVGVLKFSGRIRQSLPPQFESLSSAHFSADGRGLFHVEVECRDEKMAQDFMMFLSGMKALYMLKNEGDNPLFDLIEKSDLTTKSSTVFMDVSIDELSKP